MSATIIYFLRKDGISKAETKNAFRSSMYVWSDVAKRYCGLERFPMIFDDNCLESQMEVWNFNIRHPGVMQKHEEIALVSTMDKTLAEPSQWLRLVEAFEKYSSEHPNSSFGEQAAAIRSVMESDQASEIVAIGWQQTSVNGDSPWFSYEEDEDGEDYVEVYDPATGNTHYWLMESVDSVGVEEEVETK